MKPNDREAGKLVWQKILWSWVRGSADYIWYNLRASGFRPRDNEQGYGIFTPDLHPRCAAAAFAAFTAAFAELRADRILRDGPERQVYRFAGRRSGKDVRVIAGWDAFAREGAEIRVRTDAESAIRIDTMGGRTASSLNDGVAIWTVSADPSVLLLTGATEAEPDGNDLANDAPRPVKTITPGPEFNDQENADIILKDYDQVYELYKAMPQHQDRQWKWWNDLWVWTCFAWKDGRLKIRVRVWDDVHTPRPDDPLEGDAVVLKLGDWTLALVTGSDDRLRILGRPAGIGDPPRSAWTFVGKYDLELDPKAFGLGCEIPFNIRDRRCRDGLDGRHAHIHATRTGSARHRTTSPTRRDLRRDDVDTRPERTRGKRMLPDRRSRGSRGARGSLRKRQRPQAVCRRDPRHRKPSVARSPGSQRPPDRPR